MSKENRSIERLKYSCRLRGVEQRQSCVKRQTVVKAILFIADGEPLMGDGERIENDEGTLKADRQALKGEK